MNKNELIHWLRKNWVLNAYIIRGISQQCDGFDYVLSTDAKNQVEQLVAVWKVDRGGTLRCGKKSFKNALIDFRKNYPDYEIYDMDAHIFDACFNDAEAVLDPLKAVYYDGMIKQGKSSAVNDALEHDLIDPKEMEPIQKHYKTVYGKNFSAYKPESMTYYGTRVEGQWVAVVCVETIESDSLFLSNVYVAPEYRKRGIAYSLITWALSRYSNRKIGLYVDSTNKAAINLYQKVGFRYVCKTLCLERKVQ